MDGKPPSMDSIDHSVSESDGGRLQGNPTDQPFADWTGNWSTKPLIVNRLASAMFTMPHCALRSRIKPPSGRVPFLRQAHRLCGKGICGRG